VLQRYLLNPDSVRLREVVDAFDGILGAHVAFTESMECEHKDCPAFNYGRIEPLPQPPDPNPPGDDPLQSRLQPDLPLTEAEFNELTKLTAEWNEVCKSGASIEPEKISRFVALNDRLYIMRSKWPRRKLK